MRVLTGHCVDLGDVGLPYLPFVDLLRPVAADPELAPEAAANPALAGLLAGRPGAPGPAPGTAATSGARCRTGRPRSRSTTAGCSCSSRSPALICELAAAGPLLIVLEDVHWADRSSRDLLRYLLARLVDEPVVVVASYRSDDLHRRHPLRPLLAELVRLPGVERLELAPLPTPRSGTLVRAAGRADGARGDGRRRRRPRRGQRVLRRGAARRRAAAARRCRSALTDVLLARVEQRSARPPSRCCGSRRWPGGGCGTSWWPPSAGWPPPSWSQALAETVHHHLLVVSDDGRYRFRHALLREAVLADLLPGERVRLHAADRRLPRRDAGRRHGGRAGAPRPREQRPARRVRARRWRRRTRPAAIGAPAEQLQHLETALALWSAVPDAARAWPGATSRGCCCETAAAARTAGELHRGRRAAALGPGARSARTRDPVERARVHYTLAQALVRVEDMAGAQRESEAALALVPAQPPSEVRTWAAATAARMSYSLGRMAEGDAAAEEALAAADALGLDGAWSDTAVSQVRARQDSDPAAVERRMEEALRAGPTLRRRWTWRCGCCTTCATVAFEAGQIAEALDWTRRATARARELGMEWAFYPAELRHLQVTALYMAGDWDASLAEADVLARVPEMAAHVRAAGLLVQVGRGDPAARERLAWARGLVPRLNAHMLLTLVTAAAEIDLAAWTGDPATAVEVAGQASRRFRRALDRPTTSGSSGCPRPRWRRWATPRPAAPGRR